MLLSKVQTTKLRQALPYGHVAIVLTVLIGASACRITGRSTADYIREAKRNASESRLRDASLSLRKAIQQDPKSLEGHLLLARLENQLGNTYRAAAAYRNALELTPSVGPAHAEAAALYLKAYLQDGRRPQSVRRDIEALLPLLDKGGFRFEASRIRGFLALSTYDHSLAQTHFKAALEQRAGDPEIALALLNTLTGLRQYAEAERIGLAALAKSPNFGGLYDGLYLLYMTSKRMADANKLVADRVAANPTDGYAIIQAALHYRGHGQPDKATVLIDGLVADSRLDHRFLVAASYHERIGNLETAVSLLKRGIESVPERALQHRQNAVQALNKLGRRDEAIAMAQEIERKHGPTRDILGVSAVLRLERGKKDDIEFAFNTLRHLARKEPDNAQWRYHLGRVLLLRGDKELAQSEWRQALKEDATFLPPRLALAEVALNDSRLKEALQLTAQALRLDVSNERAKVLRVAALVLSHEPATARKELDMYLKMHPGSRDLELQNGLALLAEGKYAQAEVIFRRHEQAGDSDMRPLRGMAEVYMARRQFDDAITLLNARLAKSDEPQIRSLLAGVAMSAGRPDVAVQQYRALLAREPQSAELYVRLGEALFRSSQLEEAAAQFRKASSLSPKDPQPDLLLGWVLGKQHNKNAQEAAYRAALKKSPKNPIALTNLSEYYIDAGNGEEALRLAQAALQEAPDDPRVAETLGKVYLMRHEPLVARSIFSKLVNKYPDATDWRTLLGRSQLEAGEHAAARTTLTTALAQARPENRHEIERLIARLPQTLPR